ncbi:MAG: type II secretion system protein M [Alphaproteobacteria bacterium]|nr:hypothetical protein [Hyphomonas sp.]MBR9807399.1 type II secretion system protein M [Alphaproteobacteria bacterium]|tara:strand:+ start:29278 stop:29757 length:480 start_codon:yes stop_codon:yes gene_type:complete
MSELWTERTDRERALILSAVVLLGLMIFQLVFISPLHASHAQAKADLEVASRQLDVVNAELASTWMQEPASGASAIVGGEQLRKGLLQLANTRGLKVSRLQTGENGRLTLQFESAPPTLVYAWLAEAGKAYGAEPERASLFADEAGTVRASFEFSGAPS